MKYLFILLPFLILWLSFGLVEAFDLVLKDTYEYIGGEYVQIKVGGWYGLPYFITCFFAFVGSIGLAIYKGSEQ